MEFKSRCGDHEYVVRCCELEPGHGGKHVDSDGAKFDEPHPEDKGLAVAHYRDLSGLKLEKDPAHDEYVVGQRL